MIRTENNFYLIYEYCDGGNLDEYIYKNKFLSEKEALEILIQLVKALIEMERKFLVHRDIKPSNILFHNKKIKLGDFGLCMFLNENTKLKKTKIV